MNENQELIRRYQEGEKQLLSVIVENNLGLVHKALQGFKWAYNNHPKYDQIISYEDFFQEGAIGLCNALESYNHELGAFSTYAIIHIKQALFRFYYDKGRVIRVPYEPRKAYHSIKKFEDRYIKEFGCEPTAKELSDYSRIPYKDILELRKIFQEIKSIDSPVGSEEGSGTIGDIIPDTTDYISGVERKIALQELRRDLFKIAREVIKDEKEIKIFFAYFDNASCRLVQDIAADNGISKSKLDRIISESINKISNRYLDDLIEGYGELFSTNVRRMREKDLSRKDIRASIKLVASKKITLGDSITIINSLSQNGLKESIQATVKEVGRDDIKISFIGYDYTTGKYSKVDKIIKYSSVIDFRTEQGKIVEIVCLRGFI